MSRMTGNCEMVPVKLTEEIIAANPKVEERIKRLHERAEEYRTRYAAISPNRSVHSLTPEELEAYVYVMMEKLIHMLAYDPISGQLCCVYDYIIGNLKDSITVDVVNSSIQLADVFTKSLIINMIKGSHRYKINDYRITQRNQSAEEKALSEIAAELMDLYSLVSNKILVHYPKYERNSLSRYTRDSILDAASSVVDANYIVSARLKHMQAAQCSLSKFEVSLRAGLDTQANVSYAFVVKEIIGRIIKVKERLRVMMENILKKSKKQSKK